ncbi:MAG: YlbF family regulator [Spirochaetota bacterium]
MVINMENFDVIIDKARELSKCIEESEIAADYYKSIKLMQKDANAQQLLSRLVLHGKELNEAISSGDKDSFPGGAEAELLREEIEENALVKNFILAQKNYINLIKLVQDRIKNPIEESYDK